MPRLGRTYAMNEFGFQDIDHLARSACIDCGENDLLVLQFDHRDNRLKDIGWLVGSGCRPRRVAEELEKCDIRCANCHRRGTARPGAWFRMRYPRPDKAARARMRPV